MISYANRHLLNSVSFSKQRYLLNFIRRFASLSRKSYSCNFSSEVPCLKRRFYSLSYKNGVPRGHITFAGKKLIRGLFSTNFKLRGDENNVKFDKFGAWDMFELPLQMETSIEKGKLIPHISSSNVGFQSDLGKRPYQEDRYFLKDITQDILCCAVFDGHGGTDCSVFCVEAIENILLKHLESSSQDIESVVHHTFQELNSTYNQWSEANMKGVRCGTTCTICLLQNGIDLTVGHVGDSRALLCRRGVPRRLTTDHCPSNITERKRIEQSGGNVSCDNIGRYMVNGQLNMSRSIGDPHLKHFGVTDFPDVRSMKIKHSADSFLLLTTDGINFVLNDDEICRLVNHAQDPQSAAQSLVEQALSMSSEDNLTALVVPLGAWGNYRKSAGSMFFSFGIGREFAKSSRFG